MGMDVGILNQGSLSWLMNLVLALEGFTGRLSCSWKLLILVCEGHGLDVCGLESHS